LRYIQVTEARLIVPSPALPIPGSQPEDAFKLNREAVAAVQNTEEQLASLKGQSRTNQQIPEIMDTKQKPTRLQMACTLAAVFMLCGCAGMATGAIMNTRDKWKAGEAKEVQSLAQWKQTVAEFEARKAAHHTIAEIEKELGGHKVIIACRKKGMTDELIMETEHHLQLLGELANIIYNDPRTPEKVRAELAPMCTSKR
jgi:hypothetical protein